MRPTDLERWSRQLGGVILTPGRIAPVYALFGFVLLVVSDLLLPLWLPEGTFLRRVQALKGALEILASAALIYVLVAWAQRELRLKDRAMDEAPVGITIADARQPDNPLVYVSEGFLGLTGYPEREALGRNCRFLQGEGTDPEPVAQMRAAIDAERPVSVEVKNYRRDGTPFWNQVDVVPVTDDGKVTHFLGLQRDVTERRERKQRLTVLNRVLRHNLRNKLQVVTSQICQIEPDDEDEAAALERIRDSTDELLAVAEQIRKFDGLAIGDEGSLHRADLVAVVTGAGETVRQDYPDFTVDVSAPDRAPVRLHPTFEAALAELLAAMAGADAARVTLRIRTDGDDVRLAIVDHDGSFPALDLKAVTRDVETPLDHALGLELWLVRWATELSRGEFSVGDEDPRTLHLRFIGTPTGE